MNASADEVVRSALALSKQETLGSWNLRLTISPIANVTSSHIFICDQDGLVLSCTDLTLYCAKHQGKQLDPSVMQAVSSGSEFDSMTTLMGFYSEQQYVVAKPIVSDDETLGYVFVASDEFNIMNNWQAFFGVALAVAIAVVLVARLMSLVYSKKMAEPLDELTLAARKFALGDFSVRVKTKEKRDDEIGTLIESFNSMADTLEKSDNKRQEFIANVSHELRTPMTTIAGFADGILDGTIPPEKERESLQVISSETRRLSRLVRRMLELSRLQSSERVAAQEQFDVAEVLLRVLVSLESKITEQDLDVQTQLPDGPVLVWGDPDASVGDFFGVFPAQTKRRETCKVSSLFDSLVRLSGPYRSTMPTFLSFQIFSKVWAFSQYWWTCPRL